MKEKHKIITIILVGVILASLGTLILLFKTSVICGEEIYHYGTLKEQGFCDWCNGCFCFNYTLIKDSTGNNNFTKQVYFLDEYELKPWNVGDELKIRWCKIPGIGYRIREVWKI